MAKNAKVEREKGSRIQWFFFVVVVPIVFLITITLIVCTLFGINAFDYAEKYANKVPGLSEVVTTDEENKDQRQTGQLEATIANNNAEIEQLEADVQSKQTTIDELNQQITQLEGEQAAETTGDEKEQVDKVSDLASSFQEMDPEEAAPIIGNMEEALAVQVLEEVPSEERGDILGQMDPEAAAGIASSIMGSPTE